MKFAIATIRTLLIITCLSYSLTAAAQGVRCAQIGIDGFDTEAANAKKVLPSTTTAEPNEMTVYVTKQGRIIYAHSNFKELGAPYPIKVAGGFDNLADYTLNIMFDTEPNDAQVQAAITAHRNSIKFFLSNSIFDKNGNPNVDLYGANNIYVVYENTSSVRKARQFPDPNVGGDKPNTNCWIVPWKDKVDQHVYVKASSTVDPAKAAATLANKAFNRKGLVIINLLDDTKTSEEVRKQKLVEVYVEISQPDLNTIRREIEKHKGKTIIVIAHNGEAQIWTDDVRGRRQFTAAISEIETMANDVGSDVIILGCSSGIAARIGVASQFNSIEAMKRIGEAIHSTNMSEFVEKLSSGQLPILIEQEKVQEESTTIEGTIGTIDKDTGETKLAGTLHVITPDSAQVAKASRRKREFSKMHLFAKSAL